MIGTARIGWKLWTLALVIGLALGGAWLRQDWPALSHGRLPDGDDMMRLAQVRDWLGGQRFTDLVEHRLGAGGSGSLHWSRIADFGVAGWMLALRPLLGHAQGDVWAAIAWPVTLFVIYLGQSARLAARLNGRSHAAIAVILAAIAFPATTMFVPGRIDHHGLQIVLVLVLVEAALGAPTVRSGAAMGLSVAVSLAIGLETAPQCVTAMAALFALWVSNGAAERRRVAAFGGVLGGATLLWLVVARPEIWPTAWCDGFTPASTDATFIASGFWLLLAGATPRLPDWRMRAGVGAALGAVALAFAYRTSSVCLTGPYGSVDPLLRRLWMDRIAEAQPLFGNGLGLSLAFGSLAVVATGVTVVFLIRERRREWAILLCFQAMSVAVMAVQFRGTAMAAALAAPTLAHLLMLARARKSDRGGTLRLVAAWLVSAGLAWSVIGRSIDAASPKPASGAARADCTAATTLDQLAALPPGVMIAPIDAGAYLVGRTPHAVLAAPYHRNNLGNRAAYNFWLAPPSAAHAIARAWHARYVLACPDAFGGIDLRREGPGGMAMLLDRGAAPAWLAPLPLNDSAARLYRVLPDAPSAR